MVLIQFDQTFFPSTRNENPIALVALTSLFSALIKLELFCAEIMGLIAARALTFYLLFRIFLVGLHIQGISGRGHVILD